MALGREAALEKAREVIDAHIKRGLRTDDKYAVGGLAHGLVAALVDESEGYDWDMGSRLDEVAAAAQHAAFHHGPFMRPNEDTPFTVNARLMSGAVLRAGIKAGVVVPASEEALRALATHGSAGHDDTVQTLRAAASGRKEQSNAGA